MVTMMRQKPNLVEIVVVQLYHGIQRMVRYISSLFMVLVHVLVRMDLHLAVETKNVTRKRMGEIGNSFFWHVDANKRTTLFLTRAKRQFVTIVIMCLSKEEKRRKEKKNADLCRCHVTLTFLLASIVFINNLLFCILQMFQS